MKVKILKMKFVCVHGWAYSSKVWENFSFHLQACFEKQRVPLEIHALDLGFYGNHSLLSERETAETVLPIDEDTICIGHSLGAMWLLKNMGKTPRAFVSINGFTSFAACVPPEGLKKMRDGLQKAARTQVRHFYKMGGDRTSVVASDLNIDALLAGLAFLEAERAGPELEALACPVLALACENDRIVPAAVSRKQWQSSRLLWHKQAGHLLPVNASQWCAEQTIRWL